MHYFKQLGRTYTKLPIIVKCVLLLVLFMFVLSFVKGIGSVSGLEGFTDDKGEKGNDFKTGNDLYDSFYANVYDHLVFSGFKNDYEIGAIINSTHPNETSVIADIGCGTGHHVNNLVAQHKFNAIGVDVSPDMISKAKQINPEGKYQVGDGLDSNLFEMGSLTHILCLYFTIYYLRDKSLFFNNCMTWLMPGGYLVVHLVDRDHFDPILPPGNPLYVVSPQKYAKERIMHTKITFNDFIYSSTFNPFWANDNNDSSNKDKDKAIFDEKFKYNNGKVRRQHHELHMEDVQVIVQLALPSGFILHSKIDLVKCAYENQYLYVFTKP